MSLNVAKHVFVSAQKWNVNAYGGRGVHWRFTSEKRRAHTSGQHRREQEKKNMSDENSSLRSERFKWGRASGLLRIHFPKFPTKRRAPIPRCYLPLSTPRPADVVFQPVVKRERDAASCFIQNPSVRKKGERGKEREGGGGKSARERKVGPFHPFCCRCLRKSGMLDNHR